MYFTQAKPTSLAVLLATAKDFAKIDCSDDDVIAKITLMAAIKRGEHYYGAGFMPRVVTVKTNFNNLRLPVNRYLSDMTITYLDENEIEQPVDSSVYEVKRCYKSDYVVLKPNQVWPGSIYTGVDPLTIVYTAGLTTDRNELDDGIISGILLDFAFLYANRGDVDNEGKLPMPREAKESYNLAGRIQGI